MDIRKIALIVPLVGLLLCLIVTLVFFLSWDFVYVILVQFSTLAIYYAAGMFVDIWLMKKTETFSARKFWLLYSLFILIFVAPTTLLPFAIFSFSAPLK